MTRKTLALNLGKRLAAALVIFFTASAPGIARRLASAADGAGQSAPLTITYHLELDRPSSHIIGVKMDVLKITRPQIDVVMPAWAPGRYAIYNFAKNVFDFTAEGADGRALPWVNTDKQTWRLDTRTAGGMAIIRYKVFADTLTGSFAQFDAAHANINGAGVYMYVAGHKRDPVALDVQLPSSWGADAGIYSGLSPSPTETRFTAPDYDRLIDDPMEISSDDLVRQFKDSGKTFRVVVHCEGAGDESPKQWAKALTSALRKIVHAELQMMPTPDFSEYTFLVHVTPFIDEGDGMEHLNSTQVIVRGTPGAASLAEAELDAAHEFFHLWNVKRLRPAALGPFDYTQEDYSRSLWFAEGFTQYYSYVFLYRAGLWTQAELLQHLAGEVHDLQQDPGRLLMSAESSSFHAWFYDRAPQMQKTDFANMTISYYNKGALLAWLLDLDIREQTGGAKSLDDVMRAMYRKFYEAPAATYYLPGRGYTETDILGALNAVSGIDFSNFFKRYIQGTDELPYNQVLGSAGLMLNVTAAPGAAPSLGILGQSVDTGIRVAAVRPGGAADRAGLSEGDTLIAVDQLSLATASLTDRLKMYPPGAVVPFTVQRLGNRITIPVKLDPPAVSQYSIAENPDATEIQIGVRDGWLDRQ